MDQLSRKERYYDNGVFVSTILPEIAIRLPASFAYVGRTTFILDEIAEVDRHHLLETSQKGSVRNLVILHFESFLPEIDQTFNYSLPDPKDRVGPDYCFSPAPVRLGEHEYFHNTWFFSANENIKANPGRELARTAQLLAEHGYALPGELQMSRYVRALGADRKSELILFYLEPLAATGLRTEDFVAGGRGEPAVGALSDELTARSGQVFKVERG